MPKADIEADQLQHAEKKLKSAMTTLPFQSVNPDKLRQAIEDAKAAGVSADKIEAAESMLSKLTPEAAESPKKIGGLNGQMASKASSVDPKIKEAEKHLKKAMPTYFSKTDLEQLEQAIDYAKTIEGVDHQDRSGRGGPRERKGEEAGAKAATGAGKAVGGAINLGSTVTLVGPLRDDAHVLGRDVGGGDRCGGATPRRVRQVRPQPLGQDGSQGAEKALASVGMEMDADHAKGCSPSTTRTARA